MKFAIRILIPILALGLLICTILLIKDLRRHRSQETHGAM
jgi:hypothetical protein